MAATIDGSAGITTSASVTTGTGAVYNGIQSATAQNSTSGTSIDFTGIPSWVKRITVMFNGVSTSGTSRVQMQIGSGSVTTTGYSSNAGAFGLTGTQVAGTTTSGFVMDGFAPTTAWLRNGTAILTLLGSNTWTGISNTSDGGGVITMNVTAGISPALAGTLDRVRITTVNGTDTFDAGSINILYE